MISQKKNSQIEKESLAIVNTVKKFYQYIYGASFTIITDHKPLSRILIESKSIPIMAASRVQQWVIIMSAYDYNFTHKSRKDNGNADCLS